MSARIRVLGVLFAVLLGLLAFSASASAETRTFTPGGPETGFLVPAGVSSIEVQAVGGTGEAGLDGGNRGFGASGGVGANITATVNVKPGERLLVQFGGGGAPGGGRNTSKEQGGSGGGRSEVLLESSAVVVAGGGGGGGGSGGLTGAGGGGSATALAGQNGASGQGEGGEGGGLTAGGVGGRYYGESGEALRGGAGGGCEECATGGGGGGGYFGGGGGGAQALSGGGGGAGSSYYTPAAVAHNIEANTSGDPQEVVVSYTTPPSKCAAGSYSATGDQPCVTAGVGYYAEGEGATAEVACAVGQTTASTGSSSSSQCFAAPLSVTAVSPSGGPTAGGTAVTITGTGFTAAAVVTIGQGHGSGPTAISAASVAVISSTEITAVTGGGAKAGTFNLFVSTAAGTSRGGHADLFRYQRPSVTGVSPDAGPLTGGTPIAITGTGFLPGATVKIGSAAATNVTVISPTELTAETGAATKPGTFSVTVTSTAGTTGANASAKFTYTR